MMTLAVTGASDSHRGPVFSGRSRWSEGPIALTCYFCRFPHKFRNFCEGFGCFRRSFGPRGPDGGPNTTRGARAYFKEK